MKFSSVYSTVFLTLGAFGLAAPVQASSDDVKVSLTVIRSASDLQYAYVFYNSTEPTAFHLGYDDGANKTPVGFTLKSDTTLVTTDGKSVYYNNKTGEIGVVTGDDEPTKGFSIQGKETRRLALNDLQSWSAVPKNDGYILEYNSANEKALGIALQLTN